MPEEKIKLPTKRQKPQLTSPRNLILFGLPKVGKTTELSKLDDNLILDFEQGTGFVESMSIHIDSLKKLKQVGDEIIAQGRPYKYVSVDTATALEDMCLPYAKYLYMKTPMGSTFDGDSVLDLPKGAGYLYLRNAFEEMLDYVKTLADRTIIVGHVKDKLINNDGTEFTAMSLDLTGKISSITAGDSDAIGYLYRKDDKLYVNFKSSDTVVCGTRCDHLIGYNGPFDWSKIYID